METSFRPPFEDSGRTLFEIIESAEEGNVPTHGECYYAMLALKSLKFFSEQDGQRISEAVLEKKSPVVQEMAAKWAVEEPFKRNKAAYARTPLQYIGLHNLPGHPEQVKMRGIALGILKKVTESKP